MELSLQGEPSLAQKLNHINRSFYNCKDSCKNSIDFLYATNSSNEKDLNKIKQSLETLKDHNYEPDNEDGKKNNNCSRAISDIDNNDIGFSHKQEIADSVLKSIDSADLSFLSNDFSFEDCTCFEQAAQLVDPTLKDSESTPFSFNNDDSVQLFRFGLTDSNDDNILNLNKNCDEIFYKSVLDKHDNKLYKSDNTKKNDHYNLYHMFELFDTNMNVKKEKKKQKDLSNQCKKSNLKNKKLICGSIKKGRRYLPNFKQEVLEYAKNHTFKETASYFKINNNTITEWSQEGKRLSLRQNSTISMPDSKYKNNKTDILGTPITKTEFILVNNGISLETDYNESSLKYIKDDLPSVDMKPDERFLKWIEKKRLQRKELTRQEVFNIARYCLKKSPANHEISLWFVLWLKRYNRVLYSVSSNIEREKYIKYPNNFKLEVVLYATLFTKNSAARVFNVSRRRMFDWFSRLNSLKDSFDLISSNGHISEKESVSDRDDKVFAVKKDKIRNKIYSELHLWYQKMFLNGARPTSSEIKEKAREIFSLYGMKEIKFSEGWLQKFCQRKNIKLRHSEDDKLLLWILTQFDNNVSLSHQEITEKSSSLIGRKKFKGSKGWTLRFLKRHRNFLQRSPTFADQLPQIAQENINVFWDNFRQSLNSCNLEPGNIGCMDEIPISFNYPDEKSTSAPLLRKTGFENCQGVVILSTLANGRILPPTIVFRGTGPKQLLQGQNVDILILYQEKGFVTIEILETWINDIWLSCVPTPNALILDSFEPHCAKGLRQTLANENCSLHVIPNGCSSKFQPLDVEITPLFKEAIKNKWKDFNVNSDLCSSKIIRKYRCPDRDTILQWIQIAYEKINRNPVSIINSFKTTGLLQ